MTLPGGPADKLGNRYETRSVALTQAGNRHMVKHMLHVSGKPEAVRRVRLFRNGRNQAVRIPRDFELDGAEAVMRRDGDRLIIEPVRKGRLLDLLARLPPLPDGFPDVDETLEPLDDVEL